MSNLQASDIIDKMMSEDAFSQWMGVERIDEKAGYSKIKMLVRKEMTNGFGILHGGVTYSFADSAFAFASNSHGKKAVSIETSMSHLKAVKVGDLLIAEAKLEHLSNLLGHYIVRVTNQEDETVALFKGTVYRKKEDWT